MASSRHHYIPQFFTREFTNEKGMLYIYDKSADKILEAPRSPKSIFHEEHRNSIITEDGINSVIEDEIFQRLDNQTSKTVKKLQLHKITDGFMTNDDISDFQFFVINLFWRLPLTDYAASDLIQRADIKANGIQIDENLRNDPGFNKLKRILFFKESIEQFDTLVIKPKHHITHIVDFDEELFVIGDNPIIFRSYMRRFTDLALMDFRMAISSKRIISYSLEPLPSFEKSMFLKYNAAVIEQSKQYVASGSLKVLQGSVEFYRELNKLGWHYYSKKRLFEEDK